MLPESELVARSAHLSDASPEAEMIDEAMHHGQIPILNEGDQV